MHSHDTHHRESAAPESERRLLIVLVVTGLYMLAEVAGGLLTGSLALLADSGRLLGDVLGLFMVPRAWALLRSVVDVLLESTPRHLNMPQIEAAMRAQAGVESVHDLHLWSITSGFDAMSGHVRSNGRRSDDVLHDLRSMLHDQFGIDHVTLQVEAADHADDGACCIADPRCFVPTAVPLPATLEHSRTGRAT